MDELVEFLQNQDVEFYRNKELSKITSIGIGGEASLFVIPDNKKKFIRVIFFLTRSNLPFFIVGNMTNILPTDNKIHKVIVSTRALNRLSFENNLVYAECGVLFSKLILSAAENSLGGCEKLFGIPGTVGGMLAMNAGAYGDSISEHFIDADVCNPRENTITRLSRQELMFSYRDSEIRRQKLIVIGARFYLVKKEKKETMEAINSVRQKRIDTQPIHSKSLGSVFKKCESHSASYLIDRCGLKGFSVGDIEVSDKHAGFFINNGSGVAKDFLKLCDIVKFKVKEKYGIVLSEDFEYLQ